MLIWKKNRRTIGDILIIEHNDYMVEFINLKNKAGFCFNSGGIQYCDPFENMMISYPSALVTDCKVYSFKKIGDEAKIGNGITILLSMEQIQDIADRTFYEAGQFRLINFTV